MIFIFLLVGAVCSMQTLPRDLRESIAGRLDPKSLVNLMSTSSAERDDLGHLTHKFDLFKYCGKLKSAALLNPYLSVFSSQWNDLRTVDSRKILVQQVAKCQYGIYKNMHMFSNAQSYNNHILIHIPPKSYDTQVRLEILANALNTLKYAKRLKLNPLIQLVFLDTEYDSIELKHVLVVFEILKFKRLRIDAPELQQIDIMSLALQFAKLAQICSLEEFYASDPRLIPTALLSKYSNLKVLEVQLKTFTAGSLSTRLPNLQTISVLNEEAETFLSGALPSIKNITVYGTYVYDYMTHAQPLHSLTTDICHYHSMHNFKTSLIRQKPFLKTLAIKDCMLREYFSDDQVRTEMHSTFDEFARNNTALLELALDTSIDVRVFPNMTLFQNLESLEMSGINFHTGWITVIKDAKSIKTLRLNTDTSLGRGYIKNLALALSTLPNLKFLELYSGYPNNLERSTSLCLYFWNQMKTVFSRLDTFNGYSVSQLKDPEVNCDWIN